MNVGGQLIGAALEAIVHARIKAAVDRVVSRAVLAATIALFGLAAIISFYFALDRMLSARFGAQLAAVLLFGGNTVALLVILIGNAILRPRRPRSASLGKTRLDKEIEAQLRKSTPELMLAAAIAGFVIGGRSKSGGHSR